MKRQLPFFILFLAIGGLLFYGCSTSRGYNKYADEFYSQGRAWFEKGEYDRAIDDFTKVLEMAPGGKENAVVYYNRGLAYYKNRQYDRAIYDFDRALELIRGGSEKSTAAPSPKIEYELFNIYKARGDSWFYQGSYNRAIDDYSEALRYGEQREELPSLYNSRGWAHVSNEEYDRAIQDFTAALRISPRLAQGYYGRGHAWRQKGDLQRALEDARKAQKLRPEDRDYDDFVYELRSSIGKQEED